MKRYFSTLTGFVLVTLVFVTSCKKDIVLEPLPTLEGTYSGVYRVITGYNGPNPDTIVSTIGMLFSDDSYFFNSLNDPDAFCSPRGSYLLAANTIELEENQRNCNSVIASDRDNPRGPFSIRRPGDSVVCIQQIADTLKQIQLLRQ